ncbi:TOG array regulator of axonemal microtubule protein 1 [Taenia solium]|eukprot:TsM_000192100 transcript=TsM_000192100 gene=TsM_000192100
MTTVCSGAGSTPNVNASATAITSASSQAITERVIVALGKFLLDSNQETRYYGRRILATLQQSPDFERTLTRYLSGQMLRAVREATDYLQAKTARRSPIRSAANSPKLYVNFLLLTQLDDPATQIERPTAITYQPTDWLAAVFQYLC